MADYTEDELWEMDDDALEAAFKEAKLGGATAESQMEQEYEEAIASPAVVEEEEEEIVETDNADNDESEEEEENEEDIGSDQPEGELEESDHDSSDEEKSEETDEDNTDETEEANPDGDADPVDAESSEGVIEEKSEPQPAQTYSFKANGKDYDFSSEEIVEQFPKMFAKAMDYTKKMQTIAPWRKTIDAIEGAELSHTDVSLMIDALKGDKEAITEVLKRTGTDTLELDTDADSNYVAKDYGRDENALAIQDIVSDIGSDPEYAITEQILSKGWDQKSWDTMSAKPELIRLLHADVKSGLYDKLKPTVDKLKVYDGNTKSDLEYYGEAAKSYYARLEANKNLNMQKASETNALAEKKKEEAQKAETLASAKAESEKRKADKVASQKRKSAAVSKPTSTKSSVIDYMDDSDEAYDEWYKNLENSN